MKRFLTLVVLSCSIANAVLLEEIFEAKKQQLYNKIESKLPGVQKLKNELHEKNKEIEQLRLDLQETKLNLESCKNNRKYSMTGARIVSVFVYGTAVSALLLLVKYQQ